MNNQDTNEAPKKSSFLLNSKKRMGEGFLAFKQVREATKATREAETKLAEMRTSFDALSSELGFRYKVEKNYNQLAAETQNKLNDTQSSQDQAKARMASYKQEIKHAKKYLQHMRKLHEKELRPYKNLADNAQARLDEAAQALTALRREYKNTKSQIKKLTDQITAKSKHAEEAITNSTARVKKIEQEILAAKNTSSARALLDLQESLVIEKSHLEDAQEQLTRADTSDKQSLQIAETNLAKQEKLLQKESKRFEEAKHNAAHTRKDFEKRSHIARDSETELEQNIVTLHDELNYTQSEYNQLSELARALNAELERMAEIIRTPEQTIVLSSQVDEAKTQLIAQEQTLTELQNSEEALRSRTLYARLAALIAVGLMMVVAIIAVLAIMHVF